MAGAGEVGRHVAVAGGTVDDDGQIGAIDHAVGEQLSEPEGDARGGGDQAVARESARDRRA